MKCQQPTSEEKHLQLMKPRMLDLFGQVPITRADIYAWLLAIPQIDPTNPRAMTYVRDYGVVDKITRAKLEGSFDEVTEQARDTSRFRELTAESPWPVMTANVFGVGHVAAPEPIKNFNPKCLKAPNRPRSIIRREKALARREKELRRQIDTSMLCRLPSSTPSLSNILRQIGSPRLERLAKAMGVSERTARRWIEQDEAPRSVMLALYWITHWGARTIDAHAHNDAIHSARVASLRLNELTDLQKQLAQIERIADFGSANDPSPQISSRLAHHVPAATPQTSMPALSSSQATVVLVA